MKNLIILLALSSSTYAIENFTCREAAHSPYRGSGERQLIITKMEDQQGQLDFFYGDYKIEIFDYLDDDLPSKEAQVKFGVHRGQYTFRSISGPKMRLYIDLDRPLGDDLFRAQLYGKNSLESSYWDCLIVPEQIDFAF